MISRTELFTRQQAARERYARRKQEADYAAIIKMIPLLAAFEEGNELYQTFDYRVLSRPLNLWAHYPERSQLKTAEYKVFPRHRRLHHKLIFQELDALLQPEQLVLVILTWEEMVVEVGRDTLSRHLSLLRRNAGDREFGISAPGVNWLIEVAPSGIAVGRFPPND